MNLGYFSSKQAELNGIVLYETPDGRTVECTQIDDGRMPPLFDDVVCLGEVTKFIRRVSKGSLFQAIDQLGRAVILAFENRDYDTAIDSLKLQIAFSEISMGRGDDASKG